MGPGGGRGGGYLIEIVRYLTSLVWINMYTARDPVGQPWGYGVGGVAGTPNIARHGPILLSAKDNDAPDCARDGTDHVKRVICCSSESNRAMTVRPM
jgi:hypothetical protein